MADLRLRLTCLNPPPATWGGEPTEFGLQDRAGAVHPGTALPDGALLFELSVALPRFGGDFVHGPPSGRFLYLSYRHRRAGAPWIGWIKIPLAGIRRTGQRRECWRRRYRRCGPMAAGPGRRYLPGTVGSPCIEWTGEE